MPPLLACLVLRFMIRDLGDLALALACLILLLIWRCPPWLVVLSAALTGAAMAMLG
jgi:chromate transporter